MKARLCPHGNRDKEKGNIRNDSANALFDIMRILLSLAAILNFPLGCFDMKGACLQSGQVSRELYVRPPKEWNCKRGVLWKIIKLPYGINEAGRQWATEIASWLLQEANFTRLFGVSQLCIQRDKTSSISLLLAKLTDELLISGSHLSMKTFSQRISSRFSISKSIIDDVIKCNGCTISQSEQGSVQLSM